jgi:small-conductance mechanosensitive channel
VAEGWVWIGSGAERVMRVHDLDGASEGVDRFSLAELYATKIREAIAEFRQARTRRALLSGSLRAGVATVLAVLLFFGLRLLLRLLNTWESKHAQQVKSVKLGGFEILGAHHIWATVRAALRVVFGIGAALLLEVYLQYVLGLFPWTWAAAQQMNGWVLAPIEYFGRGLLAMIPDAIFLIILYYVTRHVLRLIQSFFDSVGRGAVELRGFYPEWAGPTYNLVRLGVIAFSVVMAYPHVPGASSDAFRGVSLFVGALLSLGSTGVISNIIAGYTMVYRRAFREGDLIKIEQVTGFVSKIRLQVTHLRTLKNEEVIIPNSKILNSEVMNYCSLAENEGIYLYTSVGIGYETPWRQVQAMLIEAAGRTQGLAQDPAPYVRQQALGDFAVTYTVFGFCKTPKEMFRIYSDLHGHILDLFNEHSVQIMTPAYETDPEKPKVVPREEWFLPPAKAPAAPKA